MRNWHRNGFSDMNMKNKIILKYTEDGNMVNVAEIDLKDENISLVAFMIESLNEAERKRKIYPESPRILLPLGRG